MPTFLTMTSVPIARSPRPSYQQINQHQPSDSALGLVSTRSFPAIVGTADMMLKSSQVTLVGYEKIGSGYCTAVVRGKVADVRLAVEEGARTAEQFGQLVSKLVIPRPMPNLQAVFPIGSHLVEIAQQQRGYSRLSNRSIGLLETRGFPAMVGAADAMLKSADVQLASYEIIGDGLCTAIVRGTVANVAMAIEVGMQEAERIGELHAVMIIPRLLEDLEHTLPVATYWLDENEPLPMLLPNQVREKQRQLVALPELEKAVVPQRQAEPLPIQEKIEAPLILEKEAEKPIVEVLSPEID
ncbi:carbon dioxide-concentrating mechanism protein [Synechocystis sp. PCC 7339]|uniref:BMC domain-containing protein n=1 Tax=unclassified Synechocystis TaxID=2640012 RepID=UPI001BAE6397|nr:MULTISPECIES: carbon dioxide-concentrating mechanism protein [unclassified Synechocystis]QUS60471.1 carbon dioxide-concentrating mechanism protein [Synechocystis sp. PCC 7338]UAJ72088.1 carbon dioxide-concentrating mechanism protein [Synechocystis sp. PCC 7339]